MAYQHLTWEECEKRWPRLIRSMKWLACLSSVEAACAIRDYRDARQALAGESPYQGTWESWSRGDNWLISWGEDMMRHGGGEAVCHFGGPRKLIHRAATQSVRNVIH